jgi:predicted small secreted protein
MPSLIQASVQYSILQPPRRQKERNMKTIKKIAAMMLAAALVLVLPGISSLKVSAASPTTYFVFYDGDGWYYQIGTSKYDPDEKQYEAELIMTKSGVSHPKDGDSIVFEEVEAGASTGPIIDVGNVNLQNVTVVRTKVTVIVKAASIYECYILSDGHAAINGNVGNAYIYDRAAVNFNDSVSNLYIITSSVDDADPTVKVQNNVAYAKYTSPRTVEFEYYNFTNGAFDFYNGSLQGNTNYYMSTGEGPVSVASVASASAQTTAKASKSGEYDKVPKTGETLPVCVLFFTASALCFVGSSVLKRH